MADVKTHLRELSVATTIGLLKANIDFTPADLYSSPERFMKYAESVIDNNISSAHNILDYISFNGEQKTIIEHGYKLGKKIYLNPYFKFLQSHKIKWLGNDTQKGDPIDVSVGPYGFSLKEDSFILKNMGLYQFLNNLTGSTYPRGLHVFSTFAPKEYDAWFSYTWHSFVDYLDKNTNWELYKGSDQSKALKDSKNVYLTFNNETSTLPINICTNSQYMSLTSSKTREKVFSKWINTLFSNDNEYIRLKRHCSEVAGEKVCEKVNNGFKYDNIGDFFQIYPMEYYYAKTTSTETTVLKVPSQKDFSSEIVFKGCRYDIPGSQLNIISTFQNNNTKKVLEFRNECRFSHGQFNGTPEAKMYVTRNTSLTDLYTPV